VCQPDVHRRLHGAGRFDSQAGATIDLTWNSRDTQITDSDDLQQYERGMALIKHCRTILQKAEKRIDKISKEETSEDRSQTTDDV